MDEQRFEELTRKRDSEGLSEEEAAELGRLEAQREGKEYEGSADDPPPDVEAERRGATPAEAQEQADAANRSKDIDDSVMTREGHPGREQDNPPVA
jgi:hypothetical protein